MLTPDPFPQLANGTGPNRKRAQWKFTNVYHQRWRAGELETEILTHPPYSRDPTSCDFALFRKLKEELKGKHFNNLDELRSESTRILYSYPVERFDQVYRQWIEIHRKCIASNGAFFEKNWRGDDIIWNFDVRHIVVHGNSQLPVKNSYSYIDIFQWNFEYR